MRSLQKRKIPPKPAAGTTVRISSESHRVLKSLAESTGKSLQAVLEDAIEERTRRLYLEGLNADYAALQADPKAAAEFKKEVAAWDVTNADGLETL
jgi:predicted transcriptional regulator